ncbi:MAG: ATP-grasp domain-containing protein [Chloroflexi bacterium]|nr:ATP-grasp domain-containing protein [Chloroflexota bacterium]
MFKKILIANRGEIAVRIIRTCRDMGIATVALYDAADIGSLHVRLADECVQLKSARGYLDQEEVLQIARFTRAEAIHPGYGFLAEQPSFIRACEASGIAFIGPSAQTVAALINKIGTLNQVRDLGYRTLDHSRQSFANGDDRDLLRQEANRIGYPLMVKSCQGGRGRGSRLLLSPDNLEIAVRQAQAEAQIVYGNTRIYLERALKAAHQLEVQIVGDHHGHVIHLGEREGSLQRNNQKLIEESPAPCLNRQQREKLWDVALHIATHFGYSGAGTVEFQMDADGNLYFTEIKARIQMEHPVSEAVSLTDIVREQIRITAGLPLGFQQEEVGLRGWALQCRINAEDPWNSFLPSPGRLARFRLPGGPYVRVDTYAYVGCEIPVEFDSLLAKLVVWGEDRQICLNRMRRALEDFGIRGVQTTIPLQQCILDQEDFIAGRYTTDFLSGLSFGSRASEEDRRNLAVAAAVAYAMRNLRTPPAAIPKRLASGWHRENRRLSP